MINYPVRAGQTDVSVTIRIVDSTDGTPETGVVFNTSGLDIQYRRETAASVAITEVTLAALTTAHTDGGFLHIGNGYYRVDLPDAACAAGVAGCLVHGTCTGMVVLGCYIHLNTENASDVWATATRTLTAATNITSDGTAAPTATAVAAIQADTDDIQARIPSSLSSGRMKVDVQAVAGVVVQTSGSGTQNIGGP